MLRREVPSISAAIALLLSSGAAVAEDAEPAPAEPAAQEPRAEVVVTGTRIARHDLATPSPVLVFGRDEILASGKIWIGDFLRCLPQQGNALDAGVNYGGDGSTRVNLRGIGAGRTLVLVNGRRWVPESAPLIGTSATGGSVDLSSIPTAAVERIEVLTDAASTAYGSDAIAGVVNVVTRRSGDTTDVSLYTGTSGRGDGPAIDVTLSAGAGGERGSLFFSAGHHDQREVMAGDRGFSEFPWGYDMPVGTSGHRYSAGSGVTPAGRTLNTGGTGSALWNELVTAGYGSFIWTDPGTPGAFCGATAAGTPQCFREYLGSGLPAAGDAEGDGYNLAPEAYVVAPQRRSQLHASGDLALGSIARAFIDLSYANRQSGQDRPPEPLSLDLVRVAVASANVYNPFGTDVYVRRRLVELGRRETRQDVDTFRVLVGVGGARPSWSWDVSFDWGRSDAAGQRRGELNLPALAAALGPSMVIDGVPTCVGVPGDPFSAITGCVPLNLFGGPGTIAQDQLEGLTFTGTSRATNRLETFQANASADLLRIAVNRPVRLAIGYEHRSLAGSVENDPITSKGLTSGPMTYDMQGRYRVNEIHAELSIPIVSGVRGLDDLEATAAARAFDYSTFGSDWTYALGARWRPVRDVAVRGTYSTAFRAPALLESFGAEIDDYPAVRDPCRGPTTMGGPPLTQACIDAGVPQTGSGDTSTMMHAIVGGNPDVGPESATVYTIGVVLEPRWLPSLSVAAGYHRIEIDDVIGPYGARVLLDGCYSGAHPEYCSHVVRDPGTHLIETIYDRNENVGTLATAGVDVAVRYAVPTPRLGRFALALDATWLQEVHQTLPDGTVVQGKGTFDLGALNSFGGSGGTFPEWKLDLALAWSLGGLGAGISTHFLGGFEECGFPYDVEFDGVVDGGDFSGAGRCYLSSQFKRDVEAHHTEHAFVSYAFASRVGRTSVTVGVQNLLDREPAEIYNGLASATDAYSYDMMGRFLYLRLAQTY